MISKSVHPNDCFGCSACRNVCPHDAISMQSDIYGFMTPMVDAHKCVNCGLCDKVCPALKQHKGNLPLNSFAAYVKAKDNGDLSSSGGVFLVIAKTIISEDGSVFAASFDDTLHLHHHSAETSRELKEMCGSKYVQSDIGETYKEAKKSLQSGRKILFVGTPCQVSALRNFLQHDYKNLYTIDLVCHGVPSPGVFEGYIQYVEKLRGRKVSDFTARDNREGWDNRFRSTIRFKDGKEEYNSMLSNLWNRVFFSEMAIRQCCDHCPFATMQRQGDLTLGDFWGIERINSTFFNREGTSLVLVNTEKGKALFDSINDTITFHGAATVEEEHPTLFHPVQQNDRRDVFMDDYSQKGFGFISKKYFGYSKWLDFKIRISSIIRKHIGS